MSEIESTTTIVTAAEKLAYMKALADSIGIKYHPNIGLTTLEEKIGDVMSGAIDTAAEEGVVAKVEVETPRKRKLRLTKEASKLVRLNITCMNPAKKEWPGEVYTVSNRSIGTHKKLIPFNVEGGYHVPHVIYKQLRDKKYPHYYTVLDKNGNKTRKSKLVKEFNLTVLPPLTDVELKDLARRQALANGGEV
jgi:hypothetical protein